MADNTSKPEVKFNQAFYQQERLNDLMNVINLCWINPTQFNPRFLDYNYRVIFRVLTSYYTEIRVKLKSEKKDIDEIRHSLYDYMESHPILKPKKNASMYHTSGTNIKFDIKSWSIIHKALIIYQNNILDAAEAHGMGNPTKKDITKAVIDM